MGIYTFPVMLVGGIGLLAGVILAAASKFFAVEVDEGATKIRECLPGANCGGCGFAGCDDYAANLIANPDLPTNLCPVGGAAVAQKISEIMGVSFEAATPKHAVVHCNGTCQNTKYAIDYEGPQTCAACNTMFGGRGTCNFGCIGFGDCVAACQYDAIHIVDGVAKVDKDKCTGCGACANICPKHVIMIDAGGPRKPVVMCSNQDKGAVANKLCTTSCIACGMCERTCKFDAIHVVNNVAVIDYTKCKNCTMCAKACPRNAIEPIPTPEEKEKFKAAQKAAAERKAAAAKAAAEAKAAEAPKAE